MGLMMGGFRSDRTLSWVVDQGSFWCGGLFGDEERQVEAEAGGYKLYGPALDEDLRVGFEFLAIVRFGGAEVAGRGEEGSHQFRTALLLDWS